MLRDQFANGSVGKRTAFRGADWLPPLLITLTKFATASLLLLGSLAASQENFASPDAAALYDKALAQLQAGNLPQALESIDAIDAAHPVASEQAETLNLRGIILIRQRDYGAAERFLRAALAIEPKLSNADFNLAEIPFLEKNWPEARRRFQDMLSREAGELDRQTRQLIEYKILFTRVLEGNAGELDRLVPEVETLDDELAACYLRAAIARRRGQSAEAMRWFAQAQERFPKPLNLLYAESFCEIGWQEKQPNEPRARFQITPASERAERLQANAKADLERAEAAFMAHDDAAALRWLDALDRDRPDQAASHNLRAEIFMASNALKEAEAELRQALTADPNLHEASYNLAEIALRDGRYREARERFEQLFAVTPDANGQAAQLIKFKIFLTFLLEGKEDCARPIMARFRFTGATPALYYAEAAWAFQHGEQDAGASWISSAQRVYPPALNMIFADAFYQLGWLEGKVVGNAIVSSPATRDSHLPRSISIAAPDGNTPLLTLNVRPDSEMRMFTEGSPNDGLEAISPPELRLPTGR